MNISNKAAVQRVAQIYQEQKQANRIRKKDGSPSFTDEVTLSSEGKEIQAMLQKLKTAPDIRLQAEQLKIAVANGTYQLNPSKIAQGIIETETGS